MTPERLRALLDEVARGKATPQKAYDIIKDIPFEDIGIANLDHHRVLRTSQPEVIYGKSKTIDELTRIAKAIIAKMNNLLITRIDKTKARVLLKLSKKLRYNERGEIIVGVFEPVTKAGHVAVVSAGTSDRYVVEEAAETLAILGNNCSVVVDVGVAGIHRLFARIDAIRKANVVIVVAGMEGALASVIGGLVSVPVIAVPTSVGYGSNFGGLSALLGMLNSCSPNVTVVNIDNGFAAAYSASIINRRIAATGDQQ
ncbi:MAG: nickel pincer cofactor biosynthesis protein LarB [Spirochaetes bacterium]|nr:nickel pincer cofactor biosynthesis protein LarB [Spirochaetota bacterium]